MGGSHQALAACGGGAVGAHSSAPATSRMELPGEGASYPPVTASPPYAKGSFQSNSKAKGIAASFISSRW
jgi:hypothetical protein